VGLRALLERAWGGIAGAVHPRPAADLFGTADRLRREGRYREAAELVKQGLRRSPNSPAGHILDACLNALLRNMEAAREAFRRALSLGPEHPRALLALARISLDNGDADAARRYLERWLEYHSESLEPHERCDNPSSRTAARPEMPGSAARDHRRVPLPPGARDMVLARLTGPVLLARCERARQPAVAQQATAVVRLAAPMLARAGLGPVRRAAIEGSAETVFLQADAALVVSMALPSSVGLHTGLADLERLWTETVGDRRS
jgi:tetratricopeptide (TPR) repeat protein